VPTGEPAACNHTKTNNGVVMTSEQLSFVLVTPARNEEDNIGRTIESVIAQTHKPLCWVIVSDGSTDRTDEIIQRYLADHPWIQYVRMPEHRDRTFAAKVQCFNAGYEMLKSLDFDLIGNLDADLSFDPDYLAFIVSKFAENLQLGVAGTPFVEDGRHYDYRFTNIEHVSGACQIFRKACFEAIGGYQPIKAGGIDWVAVTTARMKGWETRTFTDKVCQHHRKMGTGNAGELAIWYKQGRKDYNLGNHPGWELFRGLYQMRRKPYVVGGLMLLSGYVAAAFQGGERPISAELLQFIRYEQMRRLKSLVGIK